MNARMDIINWQSVLTEHQVHLLREFSRLPDVNLRIVASHLQTAERHMQGWMPPDLSGLDVTTLPVRGWLTAGMRVLRENRTAQHLFCGLWSDRRLFVLLLYARFSGCKISLMSEPYADIAAGVLREQSGAKGVLKLWLRRIAYRTAGAMLGAAMHPVFAISPKAIAQFTRAGFRQDAVVPFGYFVPRMELPDSHLRAESGGLRLAFAGGTIQRKGLDIACDAMRTAVDMGLPLSLDVYGPGEAPVFPPGLGCIRWRGVIPFGMTQQVVAAYDALLVPSRFDGWAVVVNEALLQGVPVVASDAVGAAAMLSRNGAGFVFPSENTNALSSLLVSLAREPALLAAARERALAFRASLLPCVAARYMRDCYAAMSERTPPPACVWY